MQGKDTSSALSRRQPKCCSCPVSLPLHVMKARWAPCIMERVTDHGTLHFGALKRAIPGISKKMLTERLRQLEQAGILRREPRPAVRPEMLYSLTGRGRELMDALDSLRQLGARWLREDAGRGERAA